MIFVACLYIKTLDKTGCINKVKKGWAEMKWLPAHFAESFVLCCEVKLS
jgi:hypothetical protein